MIEHPNDLVWIEGDLPDVNTVPDHCWALVWMVLDVPLDKKPDQFTPDPKNNGKLSRITYAHPWEDALNPRKWCDAHPIGFWEKVKYYAWIDPPPEPKRVDVDI